MKTEADTRRWKKKIERKFFKLANEKEKEKRKFMTKDLKKLKRFFDVPHSKVLMDILKIKEKGNEK
jgi:hypothetical protein